MRSDEWLDAKLEGWLGLTINREKTKVVNFDYGYPRKAFRDLSNYAHKWMVAHLTRDGGGGNTIDRKG